MDGIQVCLVFCSIGVWEFEVDLAVDGWDYFTEVITICLMTVLSIAVLDSPYSYSKIYVSA